MTDTDWHIDRLWHCGRKSRSRSSKKVADWQTDILIAYDRMNRNGCGCDRLVDKYDRMDSMIRHHNYWSLPVVLCSPICSESFLWFPFCSSSACSILYDVIYSFVLCTVACYIAFLFLFCSCSCTICLILSRLIHAVFPIPQFFKE